MELPSERIRVQTNICTWMSRRFLYLSSKIRLVDRGIFIIMRPVILAAVDSGEVFGG